MPTVNEEANYQAGKQCQNFELDTNIHGDKGTAQEGTNYERIKYTNIIGKEFASQDEA